VQHVSQLYANDKVMFPIRCASPDCGPADKKCVESSGNPTRSEFQVSPPDVVAGEKIFRRIKCDTCHVINKIEIVPEDTMLTQDFRDRLAIRLLRAKGHPVSALFFLP
jgi:hypothetical protein